MLPTKRLGYLGVSIRETTARDHKHRFIIFRILQHVGGIWIVYIRKSTLDKYQTNFPQITHFTSFLRITKKAMSKWFCYLIILPWSYYLPCLHSKIMSTWLSWQSLKKYNLVHRESFNIQTLEISKLQIVSNVCKFTFYDYLDYFLSEVNFRT